MKRTSDLSNKTKAELTAMARRKKIPVTSGMLKDALIKAIKKGFRKIEAQRKSRTAAVKTHKRTPASKTAKKTSKKKRLKISKAKTTARKPKSITHKKGPVKEKAKKAPAKKSAPRKSKTARSPKTVKSQAHSKPVGTLSDLPERYGDHRLVVLARDANWAYAYWDLDPARVRDLLNSARQSAEQARWVLRVYSAALHPVEEKGHYFDIDIDVKTGSYYLDLSRPGARFTVEIGVMDISGMFRATAQSNPVILPLDHPSETTAPEGISSLESPPSRSH
ncbi:MAG: DUF4912 domain-containing protein [Nitrospinaceae bacterium]